MVKRSMAPVWEANHVWLIFVLVVFWTAFPVAFGSVMSTLAVPLLLAAAGIILRGGAFAGVEKIIENRTGNQGVGFHADIRRVELSPELAANVIACADHQRVSARCEAANVMIELDVLREERFVLRELRGIAAAVE